MGISYFPCAACGNVLADSADYGRCPNCNRRFHVDCIQLSCEDDEVDESESDGSEDEECYCQFCGGDDADDDQLLSFAIRKLNISKEELKRLYLEEYWGDDNGS